MNDIFPTDPIAIARTRLSSIPDVVDEPELVRVGTNAVFVAGDVVVRVSPPSYDQDLLVMQVDLASWLAARDFPTPRPLGGMELVGHCPVTVWERVPSDREPDMRDLGDLGSLFHSVTNSYVGTLPTWDPLGRMGERLGRLRPDETLDANDCSLLLELRDEYMLAAQDLTYELSPGPLHGDLHLGNVVANDAGAYLVDFDRIAIGPREWDLASPLAGPQLFGASDEQWGEFVSAYGYDLREFSGAETLVRLRALFMFSWLLTVRRTPRVRAEIARRMVYFRDPGGEYPLWSAV